MNLSNSREADTLQNENIELKRKLYKLERLVESDSLERYKFMEGAVWCRRKILREVETLSIRCKEVISECNSNMETISSSGSFKKAVHWAIDTVLLASDETHDSVNALLHSANGHLKEAKRKFEEEMAGDASSTAEDEEGNTGQREAESLQGQEEEEEEGEERVNEEEYEGEGESELPEVEEEDEN